MFFVISMKFTGWPTFGEMCPLMDWGRARFPNNYFADEL